MDKKIDSDIVISLLKWYDGNKRILPWRGSKDPYRIWVSEIMLQQTRVEAVKPYFERFMAQLPDVHALAMADEARLLKLWEGLGYYNRVRNMQKAAIQIEEQYDGIFPQSYDLIVQLSGIGSYTAGAISSIAFGETVPAVDGNVLRIIARLLLYEEDVLSQKAKNEVKELLTPLMQIQNRAGDINQALMELGATVCVPNGAPHCEVCPWREQCLACQKHVWQEYPKKAAKKARKIEERTVLVIGDGEQLLLHKREAKGLLAGMYELPNFIGKLSETDVVKEVRQLGLAPLRIKKLTEAKHIFSHIEWHMTGYRILVEPLEFDIKKDSSILENNYFLTTKEKVEKDYAIPSAFSAYTSDLDIQLGMGMAIK